MTMSSNNSGMYSTSNAAYGSGLSSNNNPFDTETPSSHSRPSYSVVLQTGACAHLIERFKTGSFNQEDFPPFASEPRATHHSSHRTHHQDAQESVCGASRSTSTHNIHQEHRPSTSSESRPSATYSYESHSSTGQDAASSGAIDRVPRSTSTHSINQEHHHFDSTPSESSHTSHESRHHHPFAIPTTTNHRSNSNRRQHSPPPMPKYEREVALITCELFKKLQSTHVPQFTAPFYYKQGQENSTTNNPRPLTKHQYIQDPTTREWGWHDTNFVRLPLSKSFKEYQYAGKPKWNVITAVLTDLKEFAEALMNTDEQSQNILKTAVTRYSDKARNSNFKVVENKELMSRLIKALPGIIDHALKLPARLEHPIPVLKKGQCRTLCLTRNLACSLLANAFLCTFPEQDGRDLPYFNFYSLFESSGDPTKTRVKREKLKCILSYFEQMSDHPHKNSIISYERRCYQKRANWSSSTDHLCPLKIVSNSKLENTTGMLQVDFANRQVGGGVLNEGSVQEEIRFSISPELICARLFTEPLHHDEVLVITGTSQFSSYSGYSSSFKHERMDKEVVPDSHHDNLGREFTQVVAMDALHFQVYEKHVQYRPEKIERELHKCDIAFTQGKHPTPVATGNWGCGAFNGDPELKFLIQWMSASANKRPSMYFHASDDNQREYFIKMADFLTQKQVTVGKLYKILMKYESKCLDRRSQDKTVFNFVIKCVSDKGFFSSLMSLF